MSDNEIEFRVEADGRVTEALRALHAAPADASYWNGLESRILAQLPTLERYGWWQVAAGWARPGLAAAAVLLAFAAAAASTGGDEAEQVVAYEAFVPVADQDEPLAIYTEADVTTQREATLRLVVSH